MSTDILKTLRDETGISVMQCKKALDEAGGDIEKARMILKKKSGDVAAKKADRELGAGTIVSAQNADRSVIISLLSETDFVAKNADFTAAAKSVADKALEGGKDAAAAHAAEIVPALIQKMGENIKLGEVTVFDGATTSLYNHNGQYASMVSLATANADLARDIAMHATAMRPSYLLESDIPEDAKAKAKEIFQKEVDEQSTDKPDDMKAKILEGKVNAYFKEQILMKQPFIKDPSKTIEQLLAASNNSITAFKIETI